MHIELSGPRVVDLNRGEAFWQETASRCDLCREQAQLYRLFDSPDALCRSCFATWHG
jgi:hypothetical protein